MIEGVTDGYVKKLTLVGVGYRAGKVLVDEHHEFLPQIDLQLVLKYLQFQLKLLMGF